ncbi:calcium/sodium antiporter [Epibacterium sp. DP7N7-1]|nr:calcium/sodium antiporter [Epibacterium sp. DP7N7-1]
MHNLETYQMAIVALGAIGFGVWLLVRGGDWTIDSASAIAERSGLSKLFIAATIVAFGTSAPELFTSINANISGYPGISVGNVIGSNIANVLMVIGLSAIIAPVLIDRKDVRIDTVVMLVATTIMAAASIYGIIPRWAGAGMVAMIICYVIYQWRASKIEVEGDDADEAQIGNPYLMVVAGITTLIIGSEMLVQGAVAGGSALGVPEAVIGMTVIAFGTSLPELVTCIAAARKGQSEMIVGGIIGSNIFNIMSVMAFSAIAKPLVIAPSFLGFDLPVVILVTLMFSYFLLARGQVGKKEGSVMFVAYLAFTAWQYANPAAGALLAAN